MEKQTLIDILKRVLNTDADLKFLCKLETDEIKTLVACIRDQVEHKNR